MPGWNAGKSLLLVLAGSALAGMAHAAPQQLLSKTVTVSFSVTIPSRGADGSSMATPRAVMKTIFVSSQGRAFLRSNRTAGKNQQTTERGPGETNMHFSGNSLVGVLPLPSGASQLTVNFDASFSSCTAQVLFGAETGKPIVFKGLNGMVYTQTGPARVSGVSCSIRAGNAFSG